MQRREFIKHISFTAAGVAASPIIFSSCSSKKPMNILFIMSDDHAYQAIGGYGSTLNQTPNIDRLAKEGVLFEQSFVTNSICGPSRAVMLTGKYSHLNGMIDNGTTFDGSQQTFTKILQQHGYLTAIVGKWHLKSEPTGFDYWNILPGQGNYYNPDFIEMGIKKRVPGYVTDLTTDFSIDWLEKRDKSKPFCMLVHHKAPHRNWMPGPKHLDLYKDKEFPLPETFFDDYKTRSAAVKEQTMKIDEDMFIDYDLKVPISPDEKEEFKDEKIGGKMWDDIYNRMTEEQKADWDKAYNDENKQFKESNLKGKDLSKWKFERYIKDYLRCIASVDDNIGRLLDYLEENNLKDNTIIVYTSDQGFYLGEHRWFDKRFMYEQSLRTPLIISAPDSKKGFVNKSDMVMNIDYAPTFLDYAGIQIPHEMQGRSLRKILGGNPPADWRQAVYYHYFEYPAVHGVKRHYGIRNSRYKLIHFYYDIDSWELYDLEKDPDEINNVYDNPEYQSLVSELKKELQKLREEYQDTDLTKFLPKENIQVTHKGIGAKVSFENEYASRYSGGNSDALFDGWRGPDSAYSSFDFSVWQGFEKNDLIAKVDFGKEIEIEKIRAGFLQHSESWIFLPDWVTFYSSPDNLNYEELGKVERKGDIRSTRIFREEYVVKLQGIKTRYLKIHAKNVGVCPKWHYGAGGSAWTFADEIIIE